MSDATQVYTVSALTLRVKQVLESGFGRVWVEGEISNFRRQQPSGHCYFTLKDAGAQLNAVLFAGSQRGMTVQLADGLAVRAWGDVTVYAPRGQYQLVVRQVEAAGQGALMQRFEALKRRLQAEGLFDAARKRPLPLLPRRVGIVTSPTGAALRDILNVVSRRFPNLHIVVAPARVQGTGAAEEIAAALDRLNALAAPDAQGRVGVPLDVAIVTRGGGSIEDLWPFNEEVVARAIVRSRLPVISAVGHEIDYTISDFAADLRAPTPSAAAELVVGRKDDFVAALERSGRDLARLARQQADAARARLEVARGARLFTEPARYVELGAQRLDGLAVRLRHALSDGLAGARERRDRSRSRLLIGAGRLAAVRSRLARAGERQGLLLARQLERRRERLESLERHLRALGPQAVLDRGYSITRTSDGTVVRSVAQAPVGTRLRTRLRDGEVGSVAE